MTWFTNYVQSAWFTREPDKNVLERIRGLVTKGDSLASDSSRFTFTHFVNVSFKFDWYRIKQSRRDIFPKYFNLRYTLYFRPFLQLANTGVALIANYQFKSW